MNIEAISTLSVTGRKGKEFCAGGMHKIPFLFSQGSTVSKEKGFSSAGSNGRIKGERPHGCGSDKVQGANMRIAVISDIHGNQLAFEAVLSDLAQQPRCDQVVIAGDLCLNGPRPREVLELVQELRCPVIQGNVDLETVTQAPEKGEKKRNAVGWTREQIGEAGIAYLASLPFSYRVNNFAGRDLLIVHANPLNLEDALFPNAEDEELERLLSGLDERVGALVFGRLHIDYVRRW